ncbi:MAG: response regulator transcription factor [Hyphomonadaceae bacterium]|nr:response regulator transcription factor [Clostridia bacterium]
MQQKILIVDDEAKIVDVLKSYLEHAGFYVQVAFDGHTALQIFEKASPSLVILDLMLPDMTGEEICKIIRKKSRVPILMLTAKVAEEDIIQGLDIGADDYMTKPFSAKQLVARVIALLRRTSDNPIPLVNTMSFCEDDLVIDVLKHEVRKCNQPINLTPHEYNILMIFVQNPARTFTRNELIEKALGDDYDGFDRIIDTHIKNLRQKIETQSKCPKYIITVHGVGYRFGGEHDAI